MPTDSTSSQPLLPSSSSSNGTYSNAPETHAQRHKRYRLIYNTCKASVQDFLSSRAQHYTVLGLVSFDLLGIFADIIINLYQCDEKDTEPVWDDVRNGLGVAGLVFSCLFMLELLLSVWAFGWTYVDHLIHIAFSLWQSEHLYSRTLYFPNVSNVTTIPPIHN